MKKILILIMTVSLVLVSYAQSGMRTISGTVIDTQGNPVIGAAVSVPGSTIGTLTDLEGRFSMNVGINVNRVEISCIGYISKTIELGQGNVYDIQLADDIETLEEVVVVGYGTQKKVNLTGSVSTLNFDTSNTASRPLFNASQALSGAIPGLQVMQGSGNPYSENFSMIIRGLGTLNSSGPLFLVDGIEQGMGNVNPTDIASITVLKDAASCAIYGNRGANGVVLVTTKNGSQEGALELVYDSVFSIEEPFKIIHTVSDYATYMELMNESAVNIGSAKVFQQSTIDQWREAKKNPRGRAASGYYNDMAYPNTDWWDVIYQTKVMQKHSVTVSGKEKRAGYNVSMTYIDNPGIIENTGYRRYFGKVNLFSDVSPWLRVGGRMWGYHTDQENSNVGPLTSLDTQKMVPGVYPYSKSLGLYGAPEANEEDPQSHNPLWDMNSTRGYTKNTQMFTNWYTVIKFLKHFHYNGDIYYKDYRQEQLSVDTAYGKYSFQSDQYVIAPKDPAELYSWMYNRRENQVKLSQTLNYNRTFADSHELGAMLGYEQLHFVYRDFRATKMGLQDESIGDLNAVAEPTSSTGYGTEYSSRSLFGRLNYSFLGKYLFEANLRYDGSSRFAPEYRWGLFPSFSAGWRISEEPWLKALDFVDNLKIRASWGQLGNNSIGNYDWQSTYGTTNYVIGQNIVNGISITAIKNYALEWEKTAITNLGFDFGLLRNRLTGTADLYHKLTSGILYTPEMFMVLGNAAAPKQNIAEVTNRGVELELGWRDDIGHFHYSVNANVSLNRNLVSKYKGKLEEGWTTDPVTGVNTWTTNIGDVSTGSTTRILEGHQINEWYLPDVYKGSGKYWNDDGTPDIDGGPVDGMIRTTNDMAWLKAMIEAGYSFYPHQGIGKQKIWYGEYIYADANGDGLYGTSYDSRFQGTSTTPKYNYGLLFTAGWKNIDFSMSWSGAAGFSIYYYRLAANSSSTTYGYGIPQSVADDHYFFDPKNPDDPRTNINSKRPRLAYLSSSQSSASSSLHLERGDFLKLRSVTLGYTLPEKISRIVYMKKLRVYVSGENLFAITGFSGLDPEMRATAGYSTMRQWAAGVSATF